MSGAGTGRYPRELLSALSRRSDLTVVPLAASRRRGAGGPSRVVQGVWREGVYYPLMLGRRARMASADVVHVPAAFAPRVSDAPLVLTIHDVLPFRYPGAVPARGGRVQPADLAGGRAAGGAGDHGVGAHARRAGGAAGAGCRIASWSRPYGVDPRFHPAPLPAAVLAERFGIDRPFVLCVGTLEPRKNLATALRAFGRDRGRDGRAAGDRRRRRLGQRGVRARAAGRRGAGAADGLRERRGAGRPVLGRLVLPVPVAVRGLRAARPGGDGLRSARRDRRHHAACPRRPATPP